MEVKKRQAFFGALLALGCFGLLSGEARASGFELRVGAMKPRLDSILFADSITLYTVQKDDFVGWFGGGEFTTNVHPNVELGLAVEGYAREIPTVYRDFVRPSGNEIEQTLRLQLIPVSALVRFMPSGRYRKLTPYVGGGISAMFWEYEEFGDFIDFEARGNPVVFDSFKSEGTTFGPMANGGLRFRVNEDFQITADYRYFWGKETMDGDFFPNEIDVSGGALTIGFRLAF